MGDPYSPFPRGSDLPFELPSETTRGQRYVRPDDLTFHQIPLAVVGTPLGVGDGQTHVRLTTVGSL